MARLFSDDDDRSYDLSGVLYLMGSDLCEMGLSLVYLWGRSFVLRSISYQNDLALLSTKKEEAWCLSFRSVL